MFRLLMSFVLFPASLFAATTTWEVDPVHSAISFKIRHLMVSNVRGTFKEFSGTIVVDDKDTTKNTATININPATVNTENEKRDAHLRDADFFEVAKYKEITFKTTKAAKKGKNFTLTGDLTMHGVTKPVTFEVTELTAPIKGMTDKLVRGLTATGKIDRKEFNMNWNKGLDKGGIALGETVDVTVEFELVEKKTEEKKS